MHTRLLAPVLADCPAIPKNNTPVDGSNLPAVHRERHTVVPSMVAEFHGRAVQPIRMAVVVTFDPVPEARKRKGR